MILKNLRDSLLILFLIFTGCVNNLTKNVESSVSSNVLIESASAAGSRNNLQ